MMDRFGEHKDVAAARAAGELAMVEVGPAPLPNDAHSEGFYPRPVQLADGRWVGVAGPNLLIRADDGERSIPLPAGLTTVRSGPAISPSGEQVLLVMEKRGRGHVIERAIDGEDDWRVVVSAWREGVGSYGEAENVWGADYGHSDDHIVVALHGKQACLSLLYRFERGFREIFSLLNKSLSPVTQGRVVVAPAKNGATVFGIVGDDGAAQLLKVGKFVGPSLVFAHPADTREHLWGFTGFTEREHGHILVCAAELAAKKKPKKPKKGTVRAVRFVPGKPPSPPTIDLEDATQWSMHPGGERALVQTVGWALHDLRGGSVEPPIEGARRAFYIIGGSKSSLKETTFVAIERAEGLELYPDTEGGLGTPVASIPLDGGNAYPAKDGSFLRVAPGKKKDWVVELWSVDTDGNAAVSAVVMFPGSHQHKERMIGRIMDTPVITNLMTDRSYFEVL